jgi:hypothetical protein
LWFPTVVFMPFTWDLAEAMISGMLPWAIITAYRDPFVKKQHLQYPAQIS